MPDAFQQHASGLYVPAEHRRTREVWTKDEWRAYEKALGLLRARKLGLFLQCNRPGCREPKIQQEQGLGGDMHLRCDCTDRVFTRSV